MSVFLKTKCHKEVWILHTLGTVFFSKKVNKPTHQTTVGNQLRLFFFVEISPRYYTVQIHYCAAFLTTLAQTNGVYFKAWLHSMFPCLQ